MSLGETAGRYRVLGHIAAGGMGEVFRASMGGVGGVEKAVALKVVKGRLARDPDFAALFVEEAKVAMTLSHANVVQSFDFGRIDDRWFLAMEYVEGVNLAELLRACEERLGQPMPHRHVLFVAVEALKGLDYAHRRTGPDGEPLHIVHRDVSPGNLLVSNEGEVKVADFGIAKSALRSFGSMAGTVKGKVPYMAPEQLRGAAVDRRADVYSVGAVLYEMLTGRRIVEDDEPTRAIPAVLEGDFPAPRALAPAIPEELERVVHKALAPDPADRYANAAAMRQDLEQLALDEGYLLSSADLADFVAEVMRGDAPEAPRPSRASTTPGRPAAAPPLAPAAPPRNSDGDPFDALLGMELEKVTTGEPFSVFTSAGGKRLATAPRPAPDTDTPRPVETGTVPGFPSRRRRRATAVAAGALLAAAAVAAVAFTTTRDPVASGTRPSATPETPGDPDAGVELRVASGPVPNATPETAGDPDAGVEARVASGRVPNASPEGRRRGGRRPGPATPAPAAVVEEARPATAAAEPAFLSVNTDPWSYVEVDGQRLGPTPQLRKELAPGRHRLRLHNPSEDLERTIVVDVSPGEHRRVTLSLR